MTDHDILLGNLRFTPDSELESTYETAHESSDESNGGSTDD